MKNTEREFKVKNPLLHWNEFSLDKWKQAGVSDEHFTIKCYFLSVIHLSHTFIENSWKIWPEITFLKKLFFFGIVQLSGEHLSELESGNFS